VAANAPVYDLNRLQRAVDALISQNERLREERAAMRSDLDEKSERILALEGEILEANQRRQDIGKRIDELIAQIDQLDAQLEAGEAS